MKQLLSLVLATALIMSMASTVLAANSTTPNPVSGVSNKGFLKVDDENYIDLSDPADIATYGETIYFPLLKSGSSNTSAVNTFTTTYNNFYSTRNNSTYSGVPTAAIEAAIAGDTSYYATSTGVDTDKKAEYDAAVAAKSDTNNYNTGSSTSDSDVYNGSNSALTGYTRKQIQAIVNQGSGYYTTTVENSTKKAEYNAAITALGDEIKYFDSGICKGTNTGLDGKNKAEVETVKNAGTSYYTETQEDGTKKVVFTAAQSAISQNQFTLSPGSLTDSSTYKGSGRMNGRTYGYIKSIVSQGTSYYQTAAGEDSTKKTNYNSARNLIGTSVYSSLNSAVSSFNSTYKTNYTIFTSLSSFTSKLSSSSSEGYVYFADRNMANNMTVSKISYEEGKSYISGLSVTAVRTSGGDRVYCVAVDVKNNTSSSTHDVFVDFRLNQKADSNYAKLELDCDLAFEVGFSTAGGDYDGEIPKNPATFRDGYGFDEDSEFEFTFEASSDLRYVVNTSGQGRIVLGLNTEFNEDVADTYPNANLDFYNGNYATFNRSGTLYIENDDDDLYVYSLSSSDVLSKVNCKYDSYENAYVITTRTLGVYIISDKNLNLSLYNTGYTESSSSSSSSSSGSGSGTGTGSGGTGTVTTPPASSTPSYNYNPPASSTAPKPAPSSSTPPSSSEPEDEEEPEEQEDPEEEEDPDEEEDNDIVPVVTDDEENEGPDKKSGISGWVWALIVAALAAVPVAIGVIYYLKGKPRTKDFFLDDGEGGDFEDFDDDSSDFSDDDDFTR